MATTAAELEQRAREIFERHQLIMRHVEFQRRNIQILVEAVHLASEPLQAAVAARQPLHNVIMLITAEAEKEGTATKGISPLLHHKALESNLLHSAFGQASLDVSPDGLVLNRQSLQASMDSLTAESFALLLPCLHNWVRELGSATAFVPEKMATPLVRCAVSVVALDLAAEPFRDVLREAYLRSQVRALVVDLHNARDVVCGGYEAAAPQPSSVAAVLHPHSILRVVLKIRAVADV